jgi:hypothetical protein
MILVCGAVSIHTQAPLASLHCPPDEFSQDDYSHPENCAPFEVLFARSVTDLGSGSGAFFRRYRDDINALATVAIASFTIVLSIATIQLWRTTERGFTELERPWIHIVPTDNTLRRFWNEISWANRPIGVTIEISFQFVNYGKVPAAVTVLHYSIESRENPPDLSEAALQQLRGNPVVASADRTDEYKARIELTIHRPQRERLLNSAERIWLWERLRYQSGGAISASSRHFDTEFLWVFNGTDDTFRPTNEGAGNRNRRT